MKKTMEIVFIEKPKLGKVIDYIKEMVSLNSDPTNENLVMPTTEVPSEKEKTDSWSFEHYELKEGMLILYGVTGTTVALRLKDIKRFTVLG